jgi:cellobiose-specific phosphotransferase system component IIA
LGEILLIGKALKDLNIAHEYHHKLLMEEIILKKLAEILLFFVHFE